MDAKSLNDLVKDWPREAWPDLEFSTQPSDFVPDQPRWRKASYHDHTRTVEECTLIFEASGMRYIVKGGLHVVEVEDCGDSGWWIGVRKLVRADPDAWIYRGHVTAETPESIHAISAAVLAMAERRGT